MHEPDHDLSSLLNDTKHVETKFVSYLENELEDISKKQAFMVFNNSTALMDAVEKKNEGKIK